jgi:hypothetical protein
MDDKPGQLSDLIAVLSVSLNQRSRSDYSTIVQRQPDDVLVVDEPLNQPIVLQFVVWILVSRVKFEELD